MASDGIFLAKLAYFHCGVLKGGINFGRKRSNRASHNMLFCGLPPQTAMLKSHHMERSEQRFSQVPRQCRKGKSGLINCLIRPGKSRRMADGVKRKIEIAENPT
jgi:hypothetical protein